METKLNMHLDWPSPYFEAQAADARRILLLWNVHKTLLVSHGSSLVA